MFQVAIYSTKYYNTPELIPGPFRLGGVVAGVGLVRTVVAVRSTPPVAQLHVKILLILPVGSDGHVVRKVECCALVQGRAVSSFHCILVLLFSVPSPMAVDFPCEA